MAKAEKKKTAKPKVNAIPKGYHSVTPVLIVKGAEQAIEFYKKAFGAKSSIVHIHARRQHNTAR
jgi:hypothetical protein